MVQRVVQTCCCAPTFHPYVVTCNIFVLYCSWNRGRVTYVLIYINSRLLQVVQILVLIGLYFLKCTIFDQLILRKIIKIVATRCQSLTLKRTKIDFGWAPPQIS